MKLHLPAAVSTRAARLALKTRKNSPTILLGVGIVAGVGTVVTACQATLKVEDVLTEIRKNKLKAEEGLGLNLPSYTEQDYKKDMAIIHIQGAVKLAKLYGPSFVLGVTSVYCLTQSHRILTSRNAGLAAAYTAVDKAYSEYRARVVADQGEEKDREYFFGKETKEVQVLDEKTGKSKMKKVTTRGVPGGSPYAKFFGEDNINFKHVGTYNEVFLRGVQVMLNQRLQAKGHVFLNEAYDDLGMDRTSEGAYVGWLREKTDFIDFGIWDDASMQRFHDFVVNGEGIWIDFNVSGPIWDQI